MSIKSYDKLPLTKTEIQNVGKVAESVSCKATDFVLYPTDAFGKRRGLILEFKIDEFNVEVDVTDYEKW